MIGKTFYWKGLDEDRKVKILSKAQNGGYYWAIRLSGSEKGNKVIVHKDHLKSK